MLLRHPRLLFGLPVGLAVLTGAAAFFSGPGYVARATMKPQGRDATVGNFSGLAAQFGVNLAGLTGGGEGVEYYAALLRSHTILEAVVTSSYRFTDRGLSETTGDTLEGTLIDLWQIAGPTVEVRRAAAIRKLQSRTTIRPDLTAGILALEVTSHWPELAAQINRRYLDALEEFNLSTRQSQATARRRFVQQRVAEGRAALEAVEDSLTRFQEQNRLMQSPDLLLERQRLQRRVDMAQQVYLTLAQAYEQARIDEVRDTPVITVVDPPERSVEDAGGWVLLFLIGGFVGFLAGLLIIFVMERWDREREANPDEARALRSALEALPRRLLPGRSVHRS